MFTKLIKIPGKSNFNQLTPKEVGEMIDAFLDHGNEHFDPMAFDDFLHAKIRDQRLIELQAKLNQNAYLTQIAGEWSEINVEFLRALSKKLAMED